jgi:2-polyprenyl-3-methyl-5-hydroxy-6-metoxy-1,4-benzoquinol methylase
MKVKELTFDTKDRIYVNPDNIIDYSDGEKKEQYIYDSLKASGDNSIFSRELLSKIRDWSSEYHFSTYRSNILRPINIGKSHTVLEIGAGCGAISRYLGETGATVTSVEGSLSRARCARQRCKDLDNVTIICSNVEEVEFDQKFDIITLIGVFEYTAKYSKRENPFHTALEHYRRLLSPNGVLIIAIENKLGLKYFSGYNEDHTGKPYVGIESRYGAKDITTFGRTEIHNMLLECKFQSVEFLYPFPDYKLPKVVISEQGFGKEGFNSTDLIKFTKDRHYSPKPKANLLHEKLVWSALDDNNVIKDLSNSFLIVASPAKLGNAIDQSLLAQFYTCNRYEPFNMYTSFLAEGDKIAVNKNRLGSKNFEGTANIDGIERNKEAEKGYIRGSNLHHLMEEALYKKWYSEFEKLMTLWIEFLRKETLVDTGASEWIKTEVRPEYFDALPFNFIIDKSNNLKLFDQEWKVLNKFDITFLVVRYLTILKKRRGLYYGYSRSYLGFVNKTLLHCGLPAISGGTLRKWERLDESIRSKVNVTGGLTPFNLTKSFLILVLYQLRDIKDHLLYGTFAQR